MSTLTHWALSDGGGARPGNEDAYLWLGPEDTDGGGYLWLVVDGEGGEGVGDVAAGMLTMTVRELYGELVEELAHPLAALDAAADEASRRLAAIADVYPHLSGTRASFCALALYRNTLYTANAGNAAVFTSRYGQLTRVGEDEIAHSIAGNGDMDPVPGSGLRAEGPVLRRGLQGDDTEGVTVLLASDGITGSIPEPMIAQALARLGARDGAEALVEVARTRWSDDDCTVAVIRFPGAVGELLTTKDAFLEWAEAGMTQWPDQTLMLRTGGGETQEDPPRSNVTSMPQISAPEGSAPDPMATAAIEATMAFSPAQVREIVAASGGPGTAPPVDSAPRRSMGTMAFSPQELSQVRAAATATSEPVGGTAAFTPSQPPVGGAVPVTAAQAPAPSSSSTNDGHESTLFFSPQQVDQIRAAAEAPTSPPVDEERTMGRIVAPTAEFPSMQRAATPPAEGNGTVVVTPQRDVPRLQRTDRSARYSKEDDTETLQSEKLVLPRSVSGSTMGWVILFVVVIAAAAAAALLLR